MTAINKLIIAAVTAVAAITASSAANACVPSNVGWVQPSPYGGWVPCNPYVYQQNDPYRVVGPYAGAGTANALQAYGVPAPVAGWAGSRVQENYNSAYREQNVPEAVIRGQTGVSMRDIRTYGIAGGPNSEVRKIGRMLGF